jgi:polyisoprenoid-binding protein YceI
MTKSIWLSLSRAGLALAALGALLAPGVCRADAYRLDAGHSSLIFRVKHLGISNFYGRFNALEGTLDLDPADVSRSRVSVTVKADSVDTNSAGRDKHVKGKAALGVEEHPLIVFSSTKVEPLPGGRLRVRGDLSFRGISRPVVAEVVRLGSRPDASGGSKIGFEATFTIKRSEFGMTGMDMVSDQVDLIAGLEWNRVATAAADGEEAR